MSDRRYWPGNSVLHAGVFLLPALPLVLTQAIYDDSVEPITYPQLGALWLLGLAINLGLIAVHELAHFATARATGIEIREIVIGHWRSVISRRIGSVQVKVRAAPDSGYVVAHPTLALLSGPRVALFLLAGVGAEAIILLLVAVIPLPFSVSLLSPGDFFSAYWRLCVLLFGAAHIVFNLLPSNGVSGGQKLPNDGKQLLNLWRTRRDRPAQRAALVEAQRINALMIARDFSTALPLLQELAERHPERVDLQKAVGTVQAELGHLDEAVAIWQGLLARPGLSRSQLVELLDTLSCVPIYYGRADLLSRADAWTNEAIRHVPDAITLKGTRGGVLVELGRPDEGFPLLREVVKRSECRIDQTISLAYLAKIAALKGDRTEADGLLSRARAIDPEHRVVKRITAELSTATPAAQPQRARIAARGNR